MDKCELYRVNNAYRIGLEGYREHSIKINNNKNCYIPCVDKSIPQNLIGFIYNDSTVNMNWDKNGVFTITGNFEFFDNKEYELVGFEVANEEEGISALIFKEKEEI